MSEKYLLNEGEIVSLFEMLSVAMNLKWLGNGLEARVGVNIEGITQKKEYPLILQRHAISYGSWFIEQNLVFQTKNNLKHSSKLCRNYLKSKEDNGISQIILWLSQFADLLSFCLGWNWL